MKNTITGLKNSVKIINNRLDLSSDEINGPTNRKFELSSQRNKKTKD